LFHSLQPKLKPSGIGFGTCQRFLFQLSQKCPPDAALPFDYKSPAAHETDGPSLPCDSLTLILACRSVKRAEAARVQLYKLLDAELAHRKAQGTYDDHADVFRKNLRIEVLHVDMASVQTILHSGEELKQRYVEVEHPPSIVVNAIYNQVPLHLAFDMQCWCSELQGYRPLQSHQPTTPFTYGRRHFSRVQLPKCGRDQSRWAWLGVAMQCLRTLRACMYPPPSRMLST
jgi:hypothetical protein